MVCLFLLLLFSFTSSHSLDCHPTDDTRPSILLYVPPNTLPSTSSCILLTPPPPPSLDVTITTYSDSLNRLSYIQDDCYVVKELSKWAFSPQSHRLLFRSEFLAESTSHFPFLERSFDQVWVLVGTRGLGAYDKSVKELIREGGDDSIKFIAMNSYGRFPIHWNVYFNVSETELAEDELDDIEPDPILPPSPSTPLRQRKAQTCSSSPSTPSYYDDIASRWDECTSWARDASFDDSVLDFVDLTSACISTALDVGTGTGTFASKLESSGLVDEVYGFDLSRSMLKHCPLGSDRLFVGSADELPWANNSFDLVFCRNLLGNVPDPASVLREMQRVAGEKILLIEYTPLLPIQAEIALRTTQVFFPDQVPYWTPSSLLSLLDSVGLEVIDSDVLFASELGSYKQWAMEKRGGSEDDWEVIQGILRELVDEKDRIGFIEEVDSGDDFLFWIPFTVVIAK